MTTLSQSAPKVAAEAVTSHDGFYSSCVTVIIAVMVVLYFDERVRGRLTSRERGTAIGWIGGVITLGLLTPLLAMAGAISDTAKTREVTAAFTFLFLVAVFGAAISIWGREDGARLRAAQAVPSATLPPLPPIPAPRPGMTEREHAGDVLGTAMVIVAQAHPAAVMSRLQRSSRAAENQRFRTLATRWTEIQQPLIALSAVYPSAAVRSAIGPLIEAASQVMVHPAALLSDSEAEPGTAALAQWQEHGTELYAVLERGWQALGRALNPEAAGPHAAGLRARRSAVSRITAGPKWLSNGQRRRLDIPMADSAEPEN